MHTINAPTEHAKATDLRLQLIERVLASRHLNHSARLQEMLLFLAKRVVEDQAEEVHEREVGHEVFDRPPDYDTVADNIVRVHASLLRKRLELYFAAEGRDEPLILEIPKGNYAPLFHERRKLLAEVSTGQARVPRDWRIWSLAGALVAVTGLAVVLAWRYSSAAVVRSVPQRPEVRQFWAQLFQPGKATDVVLGDATLATYQQLDQHPLDLFDYFDRDYLRTLRRTAAAAKLNPQMASELALNRQTDFWNVSFLWGLLQMPGVSGAQTHLYFARDYSFHALKTDNAVLVGDERSNPWMQLFHAHLAAPWAVGQTAKTAKSTKFDGSPQLQGTGDSAGHEEYFALSLLPNLSGTGRVLLVASTGGGATHAATKFLASERSLEGLTQCLHSGSGPSALPNFEGLFRVDAHRATPRKVIIQVCQRIQ
ncbi:MAG: hypothetical protein ACRD2G_07405 [Terriglobia bacterium]